MNSDNIIDTSIIEQEAFDLIRSVMGGSFNTLITSYIKTVEELLESIDTGKSEDDHELVTNSAHSIKSSSAQIGAMRLSDIARDIEESSSISEVYKLIDDANANFLEVKKELEKFTG